MFSSFLKLSVVFLETDVWSTVLEYGEEEGGERNFFPI